MSRTYYVTTPIYYVNDAPHIGHSYTTIAADVLARFFRADGRDVRFLTGTDEHGIKIVKAAAANGVSPRELADSVVVHFQDLWKELDISNDDFIRTSEPRHEDRVREIIRRMVARGDIYLGKYEGWYDEGQEEFVTESAARDNGYKSEISGKPLARYSEDAYFFRLNKYVPRLVEHIKANPGFVLPEARRNEVLSKLEMGVPDLCISRLAEKLGGWGVRMPNDERFTAWVWIDALANYYTALGLPEIGRGDDGKLARYWPADVHLVGKDILWFHSVHWPCFLMSIDVPLPKCVFAHGWWMAEGMKMSKTLNNFISRDDIAEVCRTYSVDVYRYFLLRAVPFGADGDFSRDQLKLRYNADLANAIGNLLSRTVQMIGKYFDGAVPACGPTGEMEAGVLAAAADLHGTAVGLMETCGFYAYLEKVLSLAAAANRYIDVTAPFKLAKDPAQKDRLATILYTCAEAVRIILLYLGPVMPKTVVAGLEQLGWAPPAGSTIQDIGRWGVLPAGAKTRKGQGLFPRKT
ncbi:MAG: methionine--tRNA ligase [Phycisphaerae bacterium]